MIKIKDLKEAIIKTNAELEEDKWIDRYDNYADLMLKYEENKIELGKKFREWEPLKFYLNVTNAKNTLCIIFFVKITAILENIIIAEII